MLRQNLSLQGGPFWVLHWASGSRSGAWQGTLGQAPGSVDGVKGLCCYVPSSWQDSPPPTTITTAFPSQVWQLLSTILLRS